MNTTERSIRERISLIVRSRINAAFGHNVDPALALSQGTVNGIPYDLSATRVIARAAAQEIKAYAKGITTVPDHRHPVEGAVYRLEFLNDTLGNMEVVQALYRRLPNLKVFLTGDQFSEGHSLFYTRSGVECISFGGHPHKEVTPEMISEVWRRGNYRGHWEDVIWRPAFSELVDMNRKQLLHRVEQRVKRIE